MKILFVPSLYDKNIKDATNITLTELSTELKKKNEKVVIISEREENKSHETNKGVEIFRKYNLPNHPGSILNIFGQFKWLYQDLTMNPSTLGSVVKENKISFDIIHGISSSPLLGLRTYLCKKYSKNAKLVHTIKGNTRYRLSKPLAFLLNFMDAVIVPTEIMKKRLSRYGCLPSKINVIKSPIDTSKFSPGNKQELKKKYGYKGKVVLYYGHLSELKGINYLIEAAKLMNDEIKFLFITPSIERYYKPYVDKIKNEGLNEKIKVIVSKVKIEDYVNLADVVVLPYPNLISTEGNPSCMLESMSCKTPVVTTDLPELKEIVKPDHDVVMVEPRNPRAIADGIMKVLNDKKFGNMLVNNAHKKVKDFDIKKIAEQHMKLYGSLVRK